MKCSNWFRQIAPTISLLGSLLLISCSDQPASGPMSPVNSNKPLVAEQNSKSTGDVRPLGRQDHAAGNSLAKMISANVAAELHMQDLIDELQYIVTNKPGTAVADKIEDVVAKIVAAQNELKKTPPDKYATLGNLAGAKSDLQAAIKDKLLNILQGSQFIAEVAIIEGILGIGSQINHDCRGTVKGLWMKRAEGGLIAHCGHKIIVPKNALFKDSMMSISINSNDYITVDFGPDGTFKSPVTIYISYREADLSSVDVNKLTLAWYDETTGKWIDLGGTVDANAKAVKVLTNHFTQYTISTK